MAKRLFLCDEDRFWYDSSYFPLEPPVRGAFLKTSESGKKAWYVDLETVDELIYVMENFKLLEFGNILCISADKKECDMYITEYDV